jgi:hypothetical protein
MFGLLQRSLLAQFLSLRIVMEAPEFSCPQEDESSPLVQISKFKLKSTDDLNKNPN